MFQEEFRIIKAHPQGSPAHKAFCTGDPGAVVFECKDGFLVVGSQDLEAPRYRLACALEKKLLHQGSPSPTPDDRLSRLASQVRRIYRQSDEAYEEVRALHAPIECAGLVTQSVSREIRRIFHNSYQEAKAFTREVESRTSAKFLHFSGLIEVLGEFPEFQTDFN